MPETVEAIETRLRDENPVLTGTRLLTTAVRAQRSQGYAERRVEAARALGVVETEIAALTSSHAPVASRQSVLRLAEALRDVIAVLQDQNFVEREGYKVIHRPVQRLLVAAIAAIQQRVTHTAAGLRRPQA